LRKSDNISLRNYNTFRLGYNASRLITFGAEAEVISFLQKKENTPSPLFVIGGGSNLLFVSDFHGTLLHSEIGEIKIEEKHTDYAIVSSGSGINWDKFVGWCVNNGFGGVENLSLIPGNVGASPVQNIGAYGVEVKDSIIKVRAVSIEDGKIREFNKDDCRFAYRNSIFKEELKGKFLVTRVYFKLDTKPVLNLGYGSLSEDVLKSGKPDIRTVRNAVINIRRAKLPDPEIIGNAGSFFKNPVISQKTGEALKTIYPQLPVYNDKPGFLKIAAGWLIDQCGWKGYRKGYAGVHEKQALVLVNYGNATGSDIYNLSEEIRLSVNKKFNIDLEKEVEVL